MTVVELFIYDEHLGSIPKSADGSIGYSPFSMTTVIRAHCVNSASACWEEKREKKKAEIKTT